MKKSIEKIMFRELKGQSKINFDKKLETLKTKYKDFLNENSLDFEMLYNFQMSDYYVKFYIKSQSISESDLGKEMRKAFSESFSKLLTKD